MSFSVFTDNSRAGRTYTTAELAKKDADARNAKAVQMGITARYEVMPYVLSPVEMGKEKIREIYSDS